MQTTYAFALGDQVDLARAVHNTFRGPYEITAILPENPVGEPQYALRSESGHERVVTEAEILPAAVPVEQAKPSPEEVKAKREADRKEREEQANSAWKDYLDERDHVARRTAELRELRLKAEAEAAEKIAKLAREAKINGTKTALANGTKASKAKAETKPAVKGKAGVKVPAKQAAKPKTEAKPTVKPAAKAPAKSVAKPAAKAKPAEKGKAKAAAKAPLKAAAKTARPKAGSVTRTAKPAPKAKARARG
jgi:hypothetical protein